eukprot:9052384-Ditylum_brightwellii.AAC.1
MENTTQYFPDQIEAETKACPNQCRQRRLFPMHYQHLKGQTYLLCYLWTNFGSSYCKESSKFQ